MSGRGHEPVLSERDEALVVNFEAALREDPASLVPCPARVTAHLGLDRPTELPCGGLAGHVPPHRYEVTWIDEGGGEA